MSGRAGRLALALAAAAAVPLAAQGPAGTDIWVAPLTLSPAAVALGAPANVTRRPGYDNQPAFLPDGRTLVYASYRDGQSDIWRVDLATGAASALTATPESEYSPTPIPGEDEISVVRVERDSTQRLWAFPLRGGAPVLLFPALRPVGYHAWLSATQAALFILGEPPTLQLADLATGTAREADRAIGRTLLALPHRRDLLYARRDSTGFVVMALDPATRARRRVAALPAGDFFAAAGGWLLAADGTRLLARRDDGTGDWGVVADLAALGVGPVTRLAVSPAGDRLALVAGEH